MLSVGGRHDGDVVAGARHVSRLVRDDRSRRHRFANAMRSGHRSRHDFQHQVAARRRQLHFVPIDETQQIDHRIRRRRVARIARVRNRIGHRVGADFVLLAIDVDAFDAEVADDFLDDGGTAEHGEHFVDRGVVALSEHELKQLAEGHRHRLTVRVIADRTPSSRELRGRDRDRLIEAVLAAIDALQQRDRRRNLVDARHRKALVAVPRDAFAGIEIDCRVSGDAVEFRECRCEENCCDHRAYPVIST